MPRVHGEAKAATIFQKLTPLLKTMSPPNYQYVRREAEDIAISQDYRLLCQMALVSRWGSAALPGAHL